nr:post-transcriptional regulator [Paenibacillus piri]
MTEAELNVVIESICNSKAEEFHLLGYEHVTGKEVWECVNDKYRKTGVPLLHQVVNDILSLKATRFMHWMTMSMYKENPFQ